MATKSVQIQQLQRAVGVKDDGIFGPNTLRAAASFYGMSPSVAAHFFGQLNVESCGFTRFEENLNYSANGLLCTFPKYFDKQSAKVYQYKPIEIANRAYANRMGNGPECSYDGWKYRGRGAIQLTGKSNYEAYAAYLGNNEPLINPDSVRDSYAFDTAFWYFGARNIWNVAKKGVSDDIIAQVTKKINGGTNGLESRIEKTKKYYNILKG